MKNSNLLAATMLAVAFSGGSDVVHEFSKGPEPFNGEGKVKARRSQPKAYGPSMTDRIKACSTRAELGSLMIKAEGYTKASNSTRRLWQRAITKRLSGDFLS